MTLFYSAKSIYFRQNDPQNRGIFINKIGFGGPFWGKMKPAFLYLLLVPLRSASIPLYRLKLTICDNIYGLLRKLTLVDILIITMMTNNAVTTTRKILGIFIVHINFLHNLKYLGPGWPEHTLLFFTFYIYGVQNAYFHKF